MIRLLLASALLLVASAASSSSRIDAIREMLDDKSFYLNRFPGNLCHNDNCAQIRYVAKDTMVVAEVILYGDVLIGFGPPCLGESLDDCPEIYFSAVEALINQASGRYPGIAVGYIKVTGE